jgi:hypothetical protein
VSCVGTKKPGHGALTRMSGGSHGKGRPIRPMLGHALRLLGSSRGRSPARAYRPVHSDRCAPRRKLPGSLPPPVRLALAASEYQGRAMSESELQNAAQSHSLRVSCSDRRPHAQASAPSARDRRPAASELAWGSYFPRGISDVRVGSRQAPGPHQRLVARILSGDE